MKGGRAKASARQWRGYSSRPSGLSTPMIENLAPIGHFLRRTMKSPILFGFSLHRTVQR